MPRYNPALVEPKWQQFWEREKTFATPEFPTGEKLYVLDMFPYPSGEGLHVGHPEGYTATDIVCRFARMRGKSVLHPMGFDAFGLPAEEHAIKTNTHPKIKTDSNIATFRRQLKMLGFSYDWDRELATTDIEYVRWTQWIFLLLFDTWFDETRQLGRPIAELPIPEPVAAAGPEAVRRYQDERRLAYQGEALVNWCPALGTVLANEEVIDGKSERGGHPVERRPLRQWMLRITAYAERLQQDLELVEWPDSTKKLQSDWIGRSTGAEVDFPLGTVDEFAAWRTARTASGFPAKTSVDSLRIYTTRPDTLFGATYMVIAPEHPSVARLTTPEQRAAVESYCQKAAAKSDRERQEETRVKTGVFTGSYAINPVTGQPIPVWIADYVLANYGTGAIMAVPAHDVRDYEFARQFELPIVAVVDPGEASGETRSEVLAGRACYTGLGSAIHSGPYDGLPTDEIKQRVTADLAAKGLARAAVNFKLRDWLFSRQRFWGEPFPLLHELDANGQPTGFVRAVPEDQLPVALPHLDDYKPHGRPEPLLTKAGDAWLRPCIDGANYEREANTMPQWAGSCWYYLRFIDPRNGVAFVDREKERAWMPVDLYVGGAEHAVLHLLYARFWHKVLFDRGYVSTPEPFRRLVHQGMILGEIEFTGYRATTGAAVSASDVEESPQGGFRRKGGGEVIESFKVTADQVEKSGDVFVLKDQPSIRVDSRAHKMSKARGNVVNPDAIVKEYGADALRLYEMFMGPLEAVKPWSMSGVSGVRNFLDRVWRMMIDDRTEIAALNPAVQDVEPTREQNQVLHRTIYAVTRGTDRLEFNTSIARMMEFVNFFTKESVRPKSAMERFTLLLAPYAPHLAEELWEALGHSGSLAYAPWPSCDEAYLKDDTLEIPVQILGKLRGKIVVAADATAETLEAAARAEPRIAELLAGKQIVKTVVVPGRMVNFVVR